MNKAIHDYADALLAAVRREMFGIDEITRLSLVAFYTGGHVLLEGNPGLGKTELVKTLGKVLKFPFGRIQFTPDLMPSDITGTYMPDFENPRGALSFRQGPVFTNLLLADEINRATPKTQSAMLEAMAEKQVTVLGEKRKLEEPFMVLATQNPIDQEGTYNLPEAQADRFMFKVAMPIPVANTVRLIMNKQAGKLAEALDHEREEASGAHLLPKDTADSARKFAELQRLVSQVAPIPSVEAHIVNMFMATNGRFNDMEGVSGKAADRVKRLVDELVTYGLGPRAAICLMLGAKAWSLLFERNATHAEGAGLASVLIPTLRHRLKLDLDWSEIYRDMVSTTGETDDWLYEKLLADFCIHTAPSSGEYAATVKSAAAFRPYTQGERW
ncbi:MAG: AAA family ATPase [Acidobacteriota bacterium]|nr:AAA family ATPase [Acidobacteriota bacterium]